MKPNRSVTSERIQRILSIIDASSTEDAYRLVSQIFEEIWFALPHPGFPQGQGRPVTEKEERAMDFFRSWRVFGAAGVPFHEWADVAAAALAFLKKYLNSGKMDYTSLPEFEAFWKLRDQRVRELEARPEYRGKFDDFQGR